MLNLGLKLPRIDEQGLWFDEASVLRQVQGTFDIARNLASDASAPLYGLVLYGWRLLFGPSLEAARALSVLLSSATAASLFFFGRRFLEARTGLIAALLFTASRTQMYYGHEARAYALVGLLCVASYYVYLRLLDEPTVRWATGLAVLSAALVYTHYVAVFIPATQVVATLWLVHPRSRALRVFLTSQAVAALLFAPLAYHLLSAEDPLPMAGWIRPPVLGDVLYVLSAFAGGPVLVALYAAVLSGAAALTRSGAMHANRDRVVLLALWLTVPLVLDFAFSFVVPSFLYRYLLYASLALFLLTAYALTHLPVPDPARAGLVVTFLAISLWGAASDPILRPDWRGAADLARAQRQNGGLTVVTPPFQLLPFAYHYAPEAFAQPDAMVARLREQGVGALPTLSGVATAAQSGGTGELVLVAQEGQIPAGFGEEMVRAGFQLEHGRDLVGVQVRVYRAGPD